jgi:hypothetical protein
MRLHTTTSTNNGSIRDALCPPPLPNTPHHHHHPHTRVLNMPDDVVSRLPFLCNDYNFWLQLLLLCLPLRSAAMQAHCRHLQQLTVAAMSCCSLLIDAWHCLQDT